MSRFGKGHRPGHEPVAAIPNGAENRSQKLSPQFARMTIGHWRNFLAPVPDKPAVPTDPGLLRLVGVNERDFINRDTKVFSGSYERTATAMDPQTFERELTI
jgi:hypothetical protein